MEMSESMQKVTVSIGLLIWIAIVSFSMGMIYMNIVDAEKERNSNKNYLEGEIQGLRSDWERENKHIFENIKEVESDVDELRKEHLNE